MREPRERAVLAGGCFWGMQDLIRKRPGHHLDPGRYRGATWPTPLSPPRDPRRSDRDRLRPTVTSYRDISAFFFQIHDPTTRIARATTAAPVTAR